MKRALALSLALAAPFALAQGNDPNFAFANELIVVPLKDHSISALVTHRPGEQNFTHAVALFPGSPGQVKLQMQNGQIVIGDLRGNFLVRARRHFLEPGFLTVVVDAPSDYLVGIFRHEFRALPRYGEDVRAVVDAVAKRYGQLDWTFVAWIRTGQAPAEVSE